VAEVVVLDTSACFAFLENEAGADSVESSLIEAREGRGTIHASFATLAEVEYVITQERGAADAALALAKMNAWPIQWLHSDAERAVRRRNSRRPTGFRLRTLLWLPPPNGLTPRSSTKTPSSARSLAWSNSKCCRQNRARNGRSASPDGFSYPVISKRRAGFVNAADATAFKTVIPLIPSRTPSPRYP
jgi:hypothetical protein